VLADCPCPVTATGARYGAMTFQAPLIPVFMLAGFVGNVLAVVVGLLVWERWLKPRF